MSAFYYITRSFVTCMGVGLLCSMLFKYTSCTLIISLGGCLLLLGLGSMILYKA
jgi:hypothetical protein